jgi:hypothetical protein
MIYKSIFLLILSFNFCSCFIKPSIINLKCNDYLDSLNNNKIVSNFKDILNLKHGREIMSYNDLIYHNQHKNLKDIQILNNQNVINVRLNDNTLYKYYHFRKIDIIGILNMIHYYYHN